jgi:hypothetical protein
LTITEEIRDVCWHYFHEHEPCCVACGEDDPSIWPEMIEIAEAAREVNPSLTIAICRTCSIDIVNMWSVLHYGRVDVPGKNDWPELTLHVVPSRRSTGRKRRVISHKRAMQVFRRDGFKCVHCGSIEDLEPDHILPFSKGGGDEIENLQTACKPCNSSRGNRVNWTGRKAVLS